MPYDFDRIENAALGCAEARDWNDRASEKLEREFLIPIERHTAALSELSRDIERFLYNACREFEEIMSTY
ncbi:MAG: hypothetical protein IKU61_03005 [Clostridia bacterium]|nr:hypothetical protein [Clostridia bacterium]